MTFKSSILANEELLSYLLKFVPQYVGSGVGLYISTLSKVWLPFFMRLNLSIYRQKSLVGCMNLS